MINKFRIIQIFAAILLSFGICMLPIAIADSKPIPKKLIVLTDLEGRRANLDVAIEAGDFILKGTPGNEILDFADSQSEFIFGGDLFDRGADNLKLRRMFLDLKRRYPARVTLLWGNREINKLSLIREYPRLRTLYGSDDLKLVQAWAEEQGLKQVLGFHQQELSELRGHPVSEAEAATDFLRDVLPGGETFEFIKAGQIGQIYGDMLFVHGGVSDRNIGEIPGLYEKIPNARNWIDRLNAWGAAQIELIRKSFSDGKKFTSLLTMYGDANWDPIGKQTLAEGRSVIYPDRFKESGNLRLPPESALVYLKTAGIRTVAVGHTPIGNIPLPLRSETGLLYLYMDTSMTEAGKKAYVTYENGVPRVRATLSSGRAVDYRIDRSDRYVGLLADDYHVVGIDPNGDYVLFRYYERYKIDEKIVKKSEIFQFKAKVAVFEANTEVADAKAALTKHLGDVKVPVLSPLDVQDNLKILKREPILFSGASKFAARPEDADLVREEVRYMITHQLDPARHSIITGGTHFGVEKIVHEEVTAWNVAHPGRKFELGAFIISQTNPSELYPKLDWVSLVGHEWDEPLFRGLDLVKECGGKAIFVGGGGVVKAGIKRAAALDVDFRLMENVTEGASKYYAQIYEKNAFSKASTIDFDSKAKFSSVQSPDEVIHSFARSGKKVFTFGGFSGQGYEHPEQVERHFKKIIAQLNPDEWIINIGVTPDGIGAGYKWTKELDTSFGVVLKYAKELKERGFETRGIVSSKGLQNLADITKLDFADNLTVYEYIRKYVDAFHIVEDVTWGGLVNGVLAPTSTAMARVSTVMYAIGGGAVTRDEWREGMRLGKDVRYVRAEANHAKAITKATRAGKPAPTSFYGDADDLRSEILEYRRAKCLRLFKKTG